MRQSLALLSIALQTFDPHARHGIRGLEPEKHFQTMAQHYPQEPHLVNRREKGDL